MTLFHYQEQYIEKLPPRSIMAMDLGTGKTRTALEYYKRHNHGEPLLIIAPASKTREGGWEREIEVVGGIENYRIVSRERLGVSKIAGRPIWWDFVPKWGGVQHSVIYDELQLGARNPSNAIFKKLRDIVKDAPIFLGLSATPVPNGYKDMMGYAILYDYVKNQTAFRARYFDETRVKGYPEILGYRNTDELDRWWRSVSFPLSRADAGVMAELPSRSIEGVTITPFEADLREYRRIKKERTTSDGELLDSPPKLFHALRQAITTPRLDALSNVLGDTDENVVVFYNYNSEREAILELLQRDFKEKTLYEWSGNAKRIPGQAEWAKTTNSVTLAQYGSASRAIELTYATVTIFFSPTYSYEQYSQALGRTYRHGQTKPTVVYCFKVAGTVDDKVWAALGRKEDFNINLYKEDEE